MTTDERPGERPGETRGDAPDPFAIIDVPGAGQYELKDGDTTIGFARYQDRGESRIFKHTVIDSGYEGAGLGSRLARFVLADSVSQGKRIVPECPFIAAYLGRHHDFDAQVDWPESTSD
ncbi:GNAT family N-acetyltransferase [Parafrigoribacterium humi]|jgi:predicted GNAT family acetyltransferase|uniref:GNAT family N-acetyltransferase n=1 Tax=Parafrigoribacterium humi TaxID=3144664 RepID=UPI0032EEF6E6